MKHFILRLLERAGYVVQKAAADYAQAQRDIARLLAAEQKLAQADHGLSPGPRPKFYASWNRRAESWQLHRRLATAFRRDPPVKRFVVDRASDSIIKS